MVYIHRPHVSHGSWNAMGLSMQTQNISSFTHHIKYLDICMEY